MLSSTDVPGFSNHTTNPLPWTQNFQIAFKGCLYVCVCVFERQAIPACALKDRSGSGKSPSSLALLISLMFAFPLERMECVLPTHRHQLRHRAARNSPSLPGTRCLALSWLDLWCWPKQKARMSRHFLLLLYYWPEERGTMFPNSPSSGFPHTSSDTPHLKNFQNLF